MNRHIIYDSITASVGALISGKKKFFANSLESQCYEEHIESIKLDCPPINSVGTYEIKAKTLAGELDCAFRVAQWLGIDYPTIIYHHGNNERPFDFKRFAKNTFYNIFFNKSDTIEANLIVVRAPFHDCKLSYYQEKMTELNNFMAMISTSVKLNEVLIQQLRGLSKESVITVGISLGGWVTNLHRGLYNSSTVYVPLLAGTLLGELFLRSKYKKMTSSLAFENPEIIRTLLNFDKLFKRHYTQNVFPLLSKFDQFIEYDVQKETYDGYPLKTIDCGHVSGALSTDELRDHLLWVFKLTEK